MDIDKVAGDITKVLITAEQIQAKVKELAAQLDEYYARGVRVMFPVHKYDNAFTAGDGNKGFIELGNPGNLLNGGFFECRLGGRVEFPNLSNVSFTVSEGALDSNLNFRLAAGTSDLPVAEEAQVTAEVMGNQVDAIHDVGVAGIHRLLHHRERLAAARVVIVCAGMEGALPSVIGGLVAAPVIAVPTSVGYGASFQGLAALLGMLNSCASNVTVVNIDNGFGAGYAASLMNRL